MTSRQLGIASLALVAAGLATSAIAHVTIDPREAAADSYFKAQFRVSHGCKGSPTVRVRVRLPEGTLSVKPQPKPGWQVESMRVRLDQPIDDGHGNKITERIGEVVWSGGRLLDEHFDEFAVVMRLPDRPGATLYFPVVQECEQGETRWIEIPKAGQSARELREPAPSLRLTPKR